MSNPPNVTSYTWGPDAQRAAVSVTFDNLGEAADLERGLWPESEPLGRHFSVRRMLSRILGMLEELGLQATFTALPCVAPYCVPGGVRVVSNGVEEGYEWSDDILDGVIDPAKEEGSPSRRKRP